MNVSFHSLYHRVIDKTSHDVVTETIHQDQPASAAKHAPHFFDNGLLMGIVMEGIRAGYDVETCHGKRQMLAVTSNERWDMPARPPAGFFVCLGAHLRRIVQTDSRDGPITVREKPGERGGSTSYVENGKGPWMLTPP